MKVCVQGSMGRGVLQGLPLPLNGAPLFIEELEGLICFSS